MEKGFSGYPMKKIIVVFVLLMKASTSLYAQEKYWVEFKDKSGVTFDPYSALSERTIQQRISMHIPVMDSTDFPVNPGYREKVVQLSDSVSWTSNWLNGIAVYASPNKIQQIKSLPFVREVISMNTGNSVLATADKFVDETSEKPFGLNKDQIALLKYQTERMKGNQFTSLGYDGRGIRIAIFDAGFPDVNKSPYFKKLFEERKIVSTYDFICRKENVYSNHWHGAATLSCIAGIADSINIGLATGAEILLARTERAIAERYSEEENWLAAVEWADKNGANIISSSLGYTVNRYFNYQMDGHSSLVARAATIAASKGILVVNAAGNEGSDSWHYIDTPADADSVLTVGGTDPETDMHIYFSSFGPTSDGRLKPNVCATGEVIAAEGMTLAKVSGTSFSTPLVAGFAACAWQAHREWTNMELFDEIEKSGNLYPYFDYAHGFGIPQADKILELRKDVEPTFDFVIVNSQIKCVLREKYSYPDQEEELGYLSRRNFYYKIEDKDGVMKYYYVLLADRKEMLNFDATDFDKGDVISVHFEGYTSSIDFPEINEEQ
jgi:serine protease AprX